MAMLKIQLKPGIDRDVTNYTGEGGWYACDKIRFQSGFPQKLGGWMSLNDPIQGVCRYMHQHVTSFSDTLTWLGTHTNLYALEAQTVYDMTPVVDDTGITYLDQAGDTVGITPSGTDLIVTVNDASGHGFNVGDEILIQGMPTFGGNVSATVVNGVQTVATAPSSTEFTYVVAAGSSTGAVTPAAYPQVSLIPYTSSTLLSAGNRLESFGVGWGTDPWGYGGWGSPAIVGNVIEQRDWFIDHIDNDVIFNIRKGEIYYWERTKALSYDSGTGTTTFNQDETLPVCLSFRPTLLSEVAKKYGYDDSDPALPDANIPTQVHQVLVSQQDKHILAFGSTPFGINRFDPLLIRWSNQDEPWNWTPQVTNSAGDIRISRGSEIIQALPTRQEILVFTDVSLHALQFTGTTDVFALQEYANNISIASPRAAVSAADAVFWMGKDKFYMYTGRTQTMPCTLNSYVFDNFNVEYSQQVVSGTNEEWDEVWWFYPSNESESGENDRYVVFNYSENLWYYGTLERNAWIDSLNRNKPLGVFTPIPADESVPSNFVGTIYEHEMGVDADGTAMVSYIESNDIDLEDGEKFMLTRRIIPDFEFTGSTRNEVGVEAPEVALEVQPRSFPGDFYYSDPADRQNVISAQVNRFTKQVYVRARARQMAIRVESDLLGTNWRLGTLRVDARPDGKR